MLEGHSHIQIPDLLRAAIARAAATSRTRHHPIAALIGKDLRLQQMAFVVAALYVVSWAAFAWMDSRALDKPMGLLIPLTLLYGGSLAILIGSLASAEERQLGTLEWQTLLPSPAWQQWAVKVGVTFGLTLLLGAGLPALLHSLHGAHDYPGLRMWLRCRADLRAADGHQPLPLDALQECRSAPWSCRFPRSPRLSLRHGSFKARLYLALRGPDRQLNVGLYQALQPPLAMGVGLVALLVWLAFLNHRSADRSASRTSDAGTRHRRLLHRLRPVPRRAGDGALTTFAAQCRAMP